MGRRAAEYLPLPDGSMLAIGFADVGGVFRARFRGPDGRWCQWSTEIYVPPKWKPVRLRPGGLRPQARKPPGRIWMRRHPQEADDGGGRRALRGDDAGERHQQVGGGPV